MRTYDVVASMSKQLSRPSGAPAPKSAELADGTVLDLEDLAAEVTERYALAYPDEDDRYSKEWRDWSPASSSDAPVARPSASPSSI